MQHRNWLMDLRNLEVDKIIVQHNPPTDRYVYNASTALPRVLRDGKVLGWREVKTRYRNTVEVMIWTKPLNEEGCGLYVGGRIHYGENLRPLSASIFCFYDGTHKSPCHKTESDAIHCMHKWANDHGVKYMESIYG